MKFCKERNLKGCVGYLETQKSATKMTDEKKKGFKSFKESQNVEIPPPILRQSKS